MYQKPAMLTIVPKSNLHFVAIDKDDNDKDNLMIRKTKKNTIDEEQSNDGEMTLSQGLLEMEKSQLEAKVLLSPLTS